MAEEHPATSRKSEYLLDSAWQHARERLALLETVFDPGTIRHLERLGVSPGRSCLEVGGGGGSIAEWLGRCVGPTGRVVATDIDTRFLDALDYPNLEVRRHDIATDDLESGRFDLVHARGVVMYVRERRTTLQRMVAALKPGGWLLVEEPDIAATRADPGMDAVSARVFNEMNAVAMELATARGAMSATGAGYSQMFVPAGCAKWERKGGQPWCVGAVRPRGSRSSRTNKFSNPWRVPRGSQGRT